MTFTPTQQGAYVVDVLVSEYRNGVLIGTTMRDIQIIIINCSNNAPTVNNCLSLSNVTGAVVTDCNSLRRFSFKMRCCLAKPSLRVISIHLTQRTCAQLWRHIGGFANDRDDDDADPRIGADQQRSRESS